MSGVRADGATRGDRTEATSLVVAGGVLVFLPLLAVLDRLGSTWVWLCVAGALGGAIIAGLGIRWFVTEGPPLVALSGEDEPRAHRLGEPIELPAGVRLVEMRSRLVAHGLRFCALASGALLVFFDLGPVKWAVVVLFFLSFLADQFLLRPSRWVLTEQALTGTSVFGSRTVKWSDVHAVYWRYYPEGSQPPFPSGERVIIERPGDVPDLEFVFHTRAPGTAGDTFVQAFSPMIGDRLRVLKPRSGSRTAVDETPLSEVLDGATP